MTVRAATAGEDIVVPCMLPSFLSNAFAIMNVEREKNIHN
ncbi:unnamed protein product [Linum tenue]|uniref:Uncharacterized protein n=1 Tax=Linum tenue TaxID=586396 RepID=A0AAV0NNV4_9ROSI|nr:unnamed protein product [Linum tenue]